MKETQEGPGFGKRLLFVTGIIPWAVISFVAGIIYVPAIALTVTLGNGTKWLFTGKTLKLNWFRVEKYSFNSGELLDPCAFGAKIFCLADKLVS